jgi:hypothetical protein
MSSRNSTKRKRSTRDSPGKRDESTVPLKAYFRRELVLGHRAGAHPLRPDGFVPSYRFLRRALFEVHLPGASCLTWTPSLAQCEGILPPVLV